METNHKFDTTAYSVKAEALLPHSKLAEDVFDFVKERGIAVGGLVVDFQRGVKLLYNLALLASQLRRRQHTHMIIKIAAPSAMRIGQALALDTEHRSALPTFRNLLPLSPGEAGELEIGAQRSLRNAERNRADKISAAPLKEGVFLHLEHNIQTASRPAVGPGLALALNS